MSREINFEPKEKLLKGFNTIADLIGGTIGPKGRNVFIENGIQPIITNDGATIGRYTELHDKIENLGSGIIRNASNQQNDDVGDGTTTVTVLTQAIVKESLKRPENVMDIRESIKEESKKVLKYLQDSSLPITKKDAKKVALISSENEELASIIDEIIHKIGEKGHIRVEDSRTNETYYEVTDGYKAHVGYIHPDFITEKADATALFEDTPVLVTEKRIGSLLDLASIFNQFAFETDDEGKMKVDKENKPIPLKNPVSKCVVVCDDIDDSMLGVFTGSKKNAGGFQSIVIKARGPLLQDIAAATGAHMVSDQTGVTFQTIKISDLGKAKKVICSSQDTLFIGRHESAQTHATHLLKMADQEHNMYVKEKLINRAASLTGSVAILRIASPNDYDREYLKLKADDTIKAVKAALEEGIVRGGGMSLWYIAQEMNPKTVGEEILKKALTYPLKKIIENAGKDYADIVSRINAEYGLGYDAKNDKVCDMIGSGIIDPTKVERCAIENAITAASIFITAFATNTEYVED